MRGLAARGACHFAVGVELNVASFRVNADSRQSIEMVQYMNHTGEVGDPATNRAGNSHLCLLVDDLRASVQDLKSRGVQFKSDPVLITAGPNQGGLVIYLLDPDGYTLELFQPPIPAESTGDRQAAEKVV